MGSEMCIGDSPETLCRPLRAPIISSLSAARTGSDGLLGVMTCWLNRKGLHHTQIVGRTIEKAPSNTRVHLLSSTDGMHVLMLPMLPLCLACWRCTKHRNFPTGAFPQTLTYPPSQAGFGQILYSENGGSRHMFTRNFPRAGKQTAQATTHRQECFVARHRNDNAPVGSKRHGRTVFSPTPNSTIRLCPSQEELIV